MAEDVWKEYGEHPLTHSAAHYLMAIHALLEEHGYARVTDIARRLNITRGSCSISLKPLKRRGLVLEDTNRFLLLSEEGHRLAHLVARNRELMQKLLHEVLGVGAENAEIDACKMEHLLSVETTRRLAHFVALISSADGKIRALLDELRHSAPECSDDVSRCEICREACVEKADGAVGRRELPSGN